MYGLKAEGGVEAVEILSENLIVEIKTTNERLSNMGKDNQETANGLAEIGIGLDALVRTLCCTAQFGARTVP